MDEMILLVGIIMVATVLVWVVNFKWFLGNHSKKIKYDEKFATLGLQDGLIFENENIVMREVHGLNAYHFHRRGDSLTVYRKRHEKIVRPTNPRSKKHADIIAFASFKKVEPEYMEWLWKYVDYKRYKEIYIDDSILTCSHERIQELLEGPPVKIKVEDVLEVF